jgi:hypothetical protein
MILRVDFYNATGKWYAGGEVDIGNIPGFETHLIYEKILENQKILEPGSPRHYFVVVKNLNEDGDFCRRLYKPYHKDPSREPFNLLSHQERS